MHAVVPMSLNIAACSVWLDFMARPITKFQWHDSHNSRTGHDYECVLQAYNLSFSGPMTGPDLRRLS
jgi:hypothetical protein